MPNYALRLLLVPLMSLRLACAAAGVSPSAAPTNPPDLFPAPVAARPLKVALYEGDGATARGIAAVAARIAQWPGAAITQVPSAEIATRDLSAFDIVVFSGGSGSAQGKAIGEAGRAKVRAFVENGGGYLGICAGAYLACAGFDWGIGVLNAKTVSNKWRRGGGMVRAELTDAGRAVLGPVQGAFTIRYNNGPIIQPLGRAGLPAYEVLAVFRTEMAENGTPVGVMIGSPAVVGAPFGRGRVLAVSPHSEDTPGLENFIPGALAWLAAK